MDKIPVSLEIEWDRWDDGELTINVVFVETGEIRQIRRSAQWLLKRILYRNKWATDLEVVRLLLGSELHDLEVRS